MDELTIVTGAALDPGCGAGAGMLALAPRPALRLARKPERLVERATILAPCRGALVITT